MSRPLRIEYPGAWYHAMNRGRRSEQIFKDKKDYQAFIDLLNETSEMWQLRVSAYCLMPSHYHLLVQTPDANLSRAMRHINGVYTQRYNRRHGSDGPLFRGRYKAIVVSADSYLLQLARYIHRNPMKAGLSDNLGGYLWTSHKAYLSFAKKWNWLHKEFIYSLFTNNKKEWIKRYRQFMLKSEDEAFCSKIESKKWPSVLGPKSFIDWVKGSYYSLKDNAEIPDCKLLAPDPEEILRVVCTFYDVNRARLYKTQRGKFNEPRNVAVYLLRILRCDRLKEIGRRLQIENYSSVSSIIERIKIQMQNDRKLKKRIEKVTENIKKSQRQT